MALRRIARWIAGRAPGWSDAGGALPLFTAPGSLEAGRYVDEAGVGLVAAEQ